jgi:hypothetical protein
MKYLDKSEFSYKTKSELLISDLEKSIKEEGYNSGLLGDLENLVNKFELIKNDELTKYKNDIISEIKSEIAARTDGRKGRIIESLNHDAQFETAINLLNSDKMYNGLLLN